MLRGTLFKIIIKISHHNYINGSDVGPGKNSVTPGKPMLF